MLFLTMFIILVSQLEDRVRKVEAERQSLLQRLTDTKCQLTMCKSRCEEMSVSMKMKVDREEHERLTMEYKT